MHDQVKFYTIKQKSEARSRRVPKQKPIKQGASPRQHTRGNEARLVNAPFGPSLANQSDPIGKGAPLGARARTAPQTRKGAARRRPPARKKKKRPPRARRPILPRASPAVLSAMRGLTAGFGMVPGDPPLHGRARGGRSPARSKRKWISSVVKAAGPTLGVAWRSRKPDRQIRVRMKMKSSTD